MDVVGRHRQSQPADTTSSKRSTGPGSRSRDAQAPAVRDASWPRSDIDRFVLARLESAGLEPVRDADKLDLDSPRHLRPDRPAADARRDRRFLADSSSQAFEQVVDRLLASPAFGERWGRHWLDVARYGESTGSSRNMPLPHAWRYRDYVIDAFNARQAVQHVHPGANCRRLASRRARRASATSNGSRPDSWRSA